MSSERFGVNERASEWHIFHCAVSDMPSMYVANDGNVRSVEDFPILASSFRSRVYRVPDFDNSIAIYPLKLYFIKRRRINLGLINLAAKKSSG